MTLRKKSSEKNSRFHQRQNRSHNSRILYRQHDYNIRITSYLYTIIAVRFKMSEPQTTLKNTFFFFVNTIQTILFRSPVVVFSYSASQMVVTYSFQRLIKLLYFTFCFFFLFLQKMSHFPTTGIKCCSCLCLSRRQM